MNAQCSSLDMISTLPQNIIETILCLVPIQEAARTSILSKEWRYHWIKIPKLVFNEDTFQVLTDDNLLSFLEQTFGISSERKKMSKRCKFFYAIYQVLLMHQDPIIEFTLSMTPYGNYVEIDQIIFHLSRNNTIKKLTLDLSCMYPLPSSFFSMHRLTDLHLHNSALYHQPTFNGFGNLTSLYLNNVNISKETLLHLVSGSPLLKSFCLHIDDDNILGNDDSTFIELFECLPVIEHLTIWNWIIESFAEDGVPQKLPTALVHLRYFCLEELSFIGQCGLPFFGLVTRSSPNLEKLKLTIFPYPFFDEYELESIKLPDYSDIWLEHLNELEIDDFCNFEPEFEFVKIILAKSPMLKKVKIVLYHEVAKDEESKILRILLCSSRASPTAKFVVERSV